MRRRSWPAAVVVAVTLAVSGCAADAPGDLSVSASRALVPLVQHVREVAAVGSYADLKAAVAELKLAVRQQQRDGEVSPTRSNAIRDAADALLQDAEPEEPSPTPTTESPTPTPTTESPTPTPTTESPTPTPSDTSSPIVSATVGAGKPSKSPKAAPNPSP